MATLTKKFHFQSNTEGWSASGANSNVHMEWRKPHHHRRATGIGLTNGGCLRTTYRGNAAGANQWELSTTWETLGVPAGQVVNSVSAEYAYRWDFGHAFFDVNSITTNGNKSGPFTFHDSGGTLIDTFSSANALPTSGMGGRSNNEIHYPNGHGNHQTGTLTNDLNHNWLTATGSTITVPSGSNASSNTVKFRLASLSQAVVNGGDHGMSYLRLKHDRIVLNVTYGLSTARRRIIIF